MHVDDVIISLFCTHKNFSFQAEVIMPNSQPQIRLVTTQNPISTSALEATSWSDRSERQIGLNLTELPRPICGAPSGPNASTQQGQAHDTESWRNGQQPAPPGSSPPAAVTLWPWLTGHQRLKQQRGWWSVTNMAPFMSFRVILVIV